MIIKEVLIWEEFIKYLKDRQITNQYKKVKRYLLDWNFKQADFKLREPKKNKIYYFRINKQFRAFATIENNILKIFNIDNHQN